MTNSKIKQAIGLVKKALEDQKDFQYRCSRKELFSKAREIFSEAGETNLAEQANYDSNIFGYSLYNMTREDKNESWGRFCPMGIFRDKDNNEIYCPDPKWIDEKMLAHAKERVKETKNPLVLSIYYDLLFEHTVGKEKLVYAKLAKEYYDKSSSIQYGNNWMFEFLDSKLRVLEIDLMLKDDKAIKEDIKKILTEAKKISKTDKFRYSLELLKVLLKQGKRLEKENVLEIIKISNTIAEKYRNSKDYHLERSFLSIASKGFVILGDKKALINSDLEQADSYLAEADLKKESPLVEAHFLEEAYSIIERIKDPRNEKEDLRKRIEQTYLASEKDMKLITTEVKIPNSLIEEFLKNIFKPCKEDTLRTIGSDHQLIPTFEGAKAETEKSVVEHPLLYLVSRKTISDGKKINSSKGALEVTEDQIVHTLAKNISITSVLLDFIFQNLDKEKISDSDILNYLEKSEVYINQDLSAVKIGLKLFQEKNYFAALKVIVPEIEELLRKFLRRIGYPTTLMNRGVQQSISIEEIFNKMRESIGDDLFWYLVLTLCDNRGLNLRHNIAHALYKVSPDNKRDCFRMVHILLVLASIELIVER